MAKTMLNLTKLHQNFHPVWAKMMAILFRRGIPGFILRNVCYKILLSVGKAQLQLLDDFLKKAAGGQLQVAFISGEAGVGKSSLVEEFIRSAQKQIPHSSAHWVNAMHRQAQAIHIFPFARY